MGEKLDAAFYFKIRSNEVENATVSVPCGWAGAVISLETAEYTPKKKGLTDRPTERPTDSREE